MPKISSTGAVCYARISRPSQHYLAQEKAFGRYLEQTKDKSGHVVRETSSGFSKIPDRKVLNSLLTGYAGSGRIFFVSRLDRLARDPGIGMDIVLKIERQGFNLVVGNLEHWSSLSREEKIVVALIEFSIIHMLKEASNV